MKRSILTFAVAGVVSVALVAGAALAQGKGKGPAAGAGKGNGNAGVTCPYAGTAACGLGAGQGAGMGQGGWWTKVTPKTPQQEKFVAAVTQIHNEIRALNQEIALAKANKAPAGQISALRQRVVEKQADLANLTKGNAALLQQLGVPAGAGVCDGAGPKGKGAGMGVGRGAGAGAGQGAGMGRGARNGAGRGAGLGLRDGTGPNPNCPLKK